MEGRCACDAGWKDPPGGGTPCSAFDLLPADPARPGYRNESWPSWGGHPVQWPKADGGDGRWHLFTPQFANGCEVDEWGCPLDEDSDGVCDGPDKCPGTAAGIPVRPDGCAKEVPLFTPEKQSLVLEGVYFEFDSANLKAESQETLDRVAQSLIDWDDARVQVAGHTDSMGEDAYNQDLSVRRARSVRDYLVSKGVAADRLEAVGFGEREPVADNRNEAGRLQNRRVELNKL